jgi:hypothetical protein
MDIKEINKMTIEGFQWVKYDCGIHVFEKKVDFGDVLRIECTHVQLVNNEIYFMILNGITIDKTKKYQTQKSFSKKL